MRTPHLCYSNLPRSTSKCSTTWCDFDFLEFELAHFAHISWMESDFSLDFRLKSFSRYVFLIPHALPVDTRCLRIARKSQAWWKSKRPPALSPVLFLMRDNNLLPSHVKLHTFFIFSSFIYFYFLPPSSFFCIMLGVPRVLKPPIKPIQRRYERVRPLGEGSFGKVDIFFIFSFFLLFFLPPPFHLVLIPSASNMFVSCRWLEK